MGKNKCGSCCWFYAEGTDGVGSCPFVFEDVKTCDGVCSKEDQYVGKEEARHYRAVLLQHNRWRRSKEVPNHCRMVDQTELGKAIDFACRYLKVFGEI